MSRDSTEVKSQVLNRTSERCCSGAIRWVQVDRGHGRKCKEGPESWSDTGRWVVLDTIRTEGGEQV